MGASQNGADRPSVSAVIPVWNAADTIERALNSVYAQTYDNIIEVIVVDDGSTDNTVEIIRNRFPDVKLIEQENQGSPTARNRGVAEASGEYIAFLDDDDEWLPQKTSIQVQCFMKHRGLRMTIADVFWMANDRLVDDQQNADTTLVEPLLFTHVFPEIRFHYGCSGWMLDRDLFERSGGFLRHMRRSQDTELLWRILLDGYSVARVRYPLLRRYPSRARRSSEEWAAVYRTSYQGIAPTVTEVASLAGQDYGMLTNMDALRRVAAFHFRAGWGLFNVGERDLGSESLREALRVADQCGCSSLRYRMAAWSPRLYSALSQLWRRR